jgi:hypothetical protein
MGKRVVQKTLRIMLSDMESICVHHPDRPAASRCITCHKPVCGECVVVSPDGRFCSQKCRENYAAYKSRLAAQPGPSLWGAVKRFFVKLLVWTVLLGGAVVVGAKVFHVGFCERLLRLVWP